MKRLCGFTLIEVMLSMLIFTATLAAFMGFYVTVARLSESSRNLTQAMNDARVVMESMRNTAQSGGLTGPTGVTGVYAQGSNLAPALDLASLQGETIEATYANPGADPLQVTLQVSWNEWGRNRSAALDTMMTRR